MEMELEEINLASMPLEIAKRLTKKKTTTKSNVYNKEKPNKNNNQQTTK